MKKRVAVVGLDGMAWHILNKAFECGVMPNLKRLVNKSVRGILKSTIPPVTPLAWTSIATGVNSGKHGVFGFLTLSNNYRTNIIMSSYDVKYPRLHEMAALTRVNKASHVIFMPNFNEGLLLHGRPELLQKYFPQGKFMITILKA